MYATVVAVASTMKMRSILLIESDAHLREVLQISLTCMSEWNVITSDSISTGLQYIASQTVEVILLDPSTAPGNYFKLMQTLKNTALATLPPLLLITPKHSGLSHHHLNEIGILGEIVHPFDPLTLHSQIAGFLEQPLKGEKALVD